MKTKLKYTFILQFLLLFSNLYSYEIIRDPIFEDYFYNLSKGFNFENIDVYLVENSNSNAFVINDKIYFTTGLLKTIKNEDTLKAIYFHEYGHIINNHFESKKIKIHEYYNKNSFYNLFSLGLAIFTSNANIAIGTSISLNSNLVNEISKYSIDFEIQADNFMINQIKKNKINTLELISFLSDTDDQNFNYFRTHPRSRERINNLKKIDYKETVNSKKFEWIKSKYSNNSRIQSYNVFFENLEKGIFNQDEEFNTIKKQLIQYEAFKKGFFIDNWEEEFQKMLTEYSSPFLKIEYINFLLDHNIYDKYFLIENLKFDKDIMSEYFYYYIYGKYYNKINEINISNFYYCQFYRLINIENKADFFCKKYDIKDIPTLDKSYALFK